MKKLKLLYCIIAFIVALTSLGFVACEDEKTSAVTIFNPVQDSVISRFDSVEISLLKNIDAENVEWHSDDVKVLKVKDGVAEGIATGTATITASYSGRLQSQKITVVKNDGNPEIIASDIPMINGQSYTISPKLTVGNRILADVLFTFETVDSDVAIVTDNVIRALKIGQTNVKIKAFFSGEEIAEKTVGCNVHDNIGIIPVKSEFELYITSQIKGVPFVTELPLELEIYNNGELVSDPNVSWVVADENIAVIENGTVKAVKEGETFITATYTTESGQKINTEKLNVKVSVPLLSDIDGVKPDVIVDLDKSVQSYDADRILGAGYELGKIICEDKGWSFNFSDNTLNVGNLSAGEYPCVIFDKNNKLGVGVNLIVADYVVYDYDSLQKISDTENLSAYIAMANDVDCGSSGYKYLHYNDTGYSKVFSGTFNGLGHKITNFGTREAAGLFIDSFNATFKNLAVLDVSVDAGNSAALFYRGVRGGETLVDNVYIEMYSSRASNSYSAGICAFNWSGLVKITNTIVKTSGVYAANCGAFIARAREIISMVDAYTIGEFYPASFSSNVYNGQYANINKVPNVKFDDEDSFYAARIKNKINFSGFNSYWDLSPRIPIFRCVND